jgi:hypothetical protein
MTPEASKPIPIAIVSPGNARGAHKTQQIMTPEASKPNSPGNTRG